MRKTIDETADDHGASIFVIVCGSRFAKMAAFDRPITLESHGIAVALLSQRGNSQAGENAMQIERATKLLKRVWKAVFLAELVVAAGLLLLLFSHYFSFDVFVANLHRQATAATSVKQR
ncbi:MAG TPA: hypothetical protein VFM05_12840 [Candidatus Saccharimonadales bacterium]|nr:hypothetical protein [Candidatus Saccharimonadales bacterium]